MQIFDRPKINRFGFSIYLRTATSIRPIKKITVKSYQKIFLLIIVATGLIGCAAKKNGSGEVVSITPTDRESPFYVRQSAVVTRANTHEHQVLARLGRTIEELEALIREAESSADPDARIRFDYYQLRADILAIMSGIRAHLHTPVYTPRSVDSIVGNYGR